ncbi:MAG: hypothetical protein WDO19_30565 [Bacteroidota bacterium]
MSAAACTRNGKVSLFFSNHSRVVYVKCELVINKKWFAFSANAHSNFIRNIRHFQPAFMVLALHKPRFLKFPMIGLGDSKRRFDVPSFIMPSLSPNQGMKMIFQKKIET